MTRYNIERNRRIRQVRTVVWEDGAARPLLPDSSPHEHKKPLIHCNVPGRRNGREVAIKVKGRTVYKQ